MIAKEKDIKTFNGFFIEKLRAYFSSATTYERKNPPNQKNTSTE